MWFDDLLSSLARVCELLQRPIYHGGRYIKIPKWKRFTRSVVQGLHGGNIADFADFAD